jgi:hypothetical protein
MANRWALVCDQSRGIPMFGQERSYFRYIVAALVGLMSATFYFVG